MTDDLSLYLIQLRSPAGFGPLDYGPIRAAINDLRPSVSSTSNSWFVVSSASGEQIKHGLLPLLPVITPESRVKVTTTVREGAYGRAETWQLAPDPDLPRLFVIRLYKPGQENVDTSDVLAIYERVLKDGWA